VKSEEGGKGEEERREGTGRTRVVGNSAMLLLLKSTKDKPDIWLIACVTADN
jgi:hypothetical protein